MDRSGSAGRCAAISIERLEQRLAPAAARPRRAAPAGARGGPWRSAGRRRPRPMSCSRASIVVDRSRSASPSLRTARSRSASRSSMRRPDDGGDEAVEQAHRFSRVSSPGAKRLAARSRATACLPGPTVYGQPRRSTDPLPRPRRDLPASSQQPSNGCGRCSHRRPCRRNGRREHQRTQRVSPTLALAAARGAGAAASRSIVSTKIGVAGRSMPMRADEAGDEPLRLGARRLRIAQPIAQLPDVLVDGRRDAHAAAVLGQQMVEMNRAFLRAGELLGQHREHRPPDDRRLDHGARIDADHRRGVIDRIEKVGAVVRSRSGCSRVRGKKTAPGRSGQRIRIPRVAVVRMRPHQDVDVAQQSDRRSPAAPRSTGARTPPPRATRK